MSKYIQDLSVAKHIEEIENGTFTPDLSSWSFTDCTGNSDTGDLIVTYTNSTQWVSTSFPSVIGKKYKLVCHVTCQDVSGSLYVSKTYRGSSELNINISSTPPSGAGYKTLEYEYTATGTTVYIDFLLYMLSGTTTIHDISMIEVDGIEIQNYTESCRTTYLNTNHGMSNLLLTQDASGRATGILPDNTVDYVNSGGASIDTNFRPNLSKMTIKEVVSGELQEFGGDEYQGTIDIVGSSEAIATDLTNGNWNLTFDFVSDTVSDIQIYALNVKGKSVAYNFNAVVASGSLSIKGYYTGSAVVLFDAPQAIVNGANTLYVKGRTDTGRLHLYILDQTTSFNVDFNSNTVKELTTKTRRTEHRVLKTDGTYKIDNVLQLTSTPELVSQFTLNSSGRLLSYSYVDGEDHATLEDDTADADGYLIIDMVTEIGKEYIVSVLPDVVSTPLQSYYKNRVVIDSVQIPLSNQGTTDRQELEFVATATITPLYLYAADVTITYSEISLKEKAVKVAPPLPDANTVMLLDDTACIGYPDVVDRTGCSFKVYTDVSTEEEDLADYDEFVACQP